jgi:hypothetical protein
MASLLSRVGLDPKERFELGPSGKVEGRLRGCLRVLVADEEEQGVLMGRMREGKEGEEVWGLAVGGENELGALDTLMGMLEGKLAGIARSGENAERGVRPDVELMCRMYKEGYVVSLLPSSPEDELNEAEPGPHDLRLSRFRYWTFQPARHSSSSSGLAGEGAEEGCSSVRNRSGR